MAASRKFVGTQSADHGGSLAADVRVRCIVCDARSLCMAHVDGDAAPRHRSPELGVRSVVAGSGEPLFRANTPMHSLYVVRSGLIKTCVRDSQGVEQVIGFHIPGEIVGFDGIANGQHACAGISITDSEVCQLPMSSLTSLAESEPGLHREINRLMARELAGRRLQLMLFRGRADQRVAWFLLDLAERTTSATAPRTFLQLGMSRSDIGNMLGVQIETVSRILRVLIRDGLIAVMGRRITLLDPAGLRALMRQPLREYVVGVRHTDRRTTRIC